MQRPIKEEQKREEQIRITKPLTQSEKGQPPPAQTNQAPQDDQLEQNEKPQENFLQESAADQKDPEQIINEDLSLEEKETPKSKKKIIIFAGIFVFIFLVIFLFIVLLLSSGGGENQTAQEAPASNIPTTTPRPTSEAELMPRANQTP